MMEYTMYRLLATNQLATVPLVQLCFKTQLL